jgi:tyrosine-protein kinase Etk/Wzc
MFHGDNTNGLTDYLVGDADLEKAVRATGLYNLDFISAGTVPPNPAELLGSERMRKMLEELRGRYDTILLDAPPTLAVTDAAVLTTFADATVMVVEIGGVGAKAAQRAMEVLRSTRTPLAGLILNDKRNRGVEYYGYYGRYGKYAFGYGEA